MTRRQLLVNWIRLGLLRWCLVRGRALPTFGMALLRFLDGRALALQRRRGTR